MMDYRAVLLIAFAMIVGSVSVAQARHSDARHCADDCRRFNDGKSYDIKLDKKFAVVSKRTDWL